MSFELLLLYIYWYRYLDVHLVWDFLCFLYQDICFLLQVWEFFSHNLFKYIFDSQFSFFPSGIPLCVDRHTLYYPTDLIYCFFFHTCLSVCHSDWMISIILFSRSLICSALFSLIFMVFNLSFISAVELLNFDWLLFTVSSSLLQWSEFLSVKYYRN